MTKTTTDRILYALFCLSRDTQHIDASELARAARVSATAAGEALLALEQAGLVDATRARLTMLGLARAVRLSSRRGGGQPRVDLSQAQPRKVREAAPLAAAEAPAKPATVAYSYREVAAPSQSQGAAEARGENEANTPESPTRPCILQ